MSEHLSDILDQALARLAAGEPVEAILADYPSQRDALFPLLLAAWELSPLRAVPPPPDPEAGLADFMRTAKSLRNESAVQPRRRRWLARRLVTLGELWWYPQVRWATGIALAVAFMFVLLAGAVTLAADSLPGDWLYPVKLAREEVHLSLTFDQADRAAQQLERTQARAAEIRRLVQAGRPVEGTALARLERSLEATLREVALAEPTQIPPLLTAVDEVVLEQQALLAALEATAVTQPTREVLDQAQASLDRTHALALAGRSDVPAFRLNARLGALRIGSPESELPEPDPLGQRPTPTPTILAFDTATPPAEQTEEPDPTGGASTDRPTVTATARPTATPTPTAPVGPSPTPEPALISEPGHTATPPGQTPTPEPPGQTHTPEPPGQTHTPEPPGQTHTPEPPGQSHTPEPPGQSHTPEPPGQSHTPEPPGQSHTPEPPGKTKSPKKP